MNPGVTTAPPSPAAVGGLLDAVRALAPDLSARAAEAEALGTMPADLVRRVEAAGLFRMVRPRALGGLELDPAGFVEVVEELAHADGSAAWTVLIGSTACALFGRLEPEVARAMLLDRPEAAATCVFAPGGTAVPDGDGRYVVSGRWGYNSGCRHSAWLQVGVMVTDGGRPRVTEDGTPDHRLAFVPARDAEILDTWDVAGLRGTGSDDLVVRDVRVPAERMIRLADRGRHDGPLSRLPIYTLIQVSAMGFPLGVARRALDEFTDLARSKMRGATARWSVADDSHVQVELGRAEATLAAARAYVHDAVRRLWDVACAGEDPGIDVRAGVGMATQHAMRAATSVVDTVFTHAGGSAVHAASPLQRCFRDIHVAAQHIFFAADADRRYGRLRLGIEQPTTML